MAAAVAKPSTTTGVLTMWGGTSDGSDAFVDYKSGASNVNVTLDFEIVLEDMRTLNPPASYAKNGYEYRTAPTALTTEQFINGDKNAEMDPEMRKVIEDAYFKEIGAITEDATKGDLVIPYGFHIRQQGFDATDLVAAKLARGSLNVAHSDLDHGNATQRMENTIGKEKAQELIGKYKRWASVNIWRPIGTEVQKWPLALVNHDKVPDFDYETHMMRVHSRNGDAIKGRAQKGHDTILKHHPDYTYHYTSNLKPEEVLVFGSFDTNAAMMPPHGAFWDNSSSPDAPTRRSIEARSWVFWDPVE